MKILRLRKMITDSTTVVLHSGFDFDFLCRGIVKPRMILCMVVTMYLCRYRNRFTPAPYETPRLELFLMVMIVTTTGMCRDRNRIIPARYENPRLHRTVHTQRNLSLVHGCFKLQIGQQAVIVALFYLQSVTGKFGKLRYSKVLLIFFYSW